MPSGNPNIDKAGANTQFQPGVSGNPAGKPKGTKHITTHIQEMLEDPKFDIRMLDPKEGYKEYKDRPVKAILGVLTNKAIAGDLKAADLLLKYGWSQKQEIEHTGAIATGEPDPVLAAEFQEFLRQKTKGD